MTISFENELTAIINDYSEAQKQSRHEDVSDVLRMSEAVQLQTRCIAAIARASSRASTYMDQINAIKEMHMNQWNKLGCFIGVVRALYQNIKSGYMATLEELVHGELFSDFLEMSQHLLDAGFKDASAVIAGSTLESHLKQLCVKYKNPTDNNGKNKKADTINSELVQLSAYTKSDQKSVTAWLDLRNKAAHGEYSSYDKDQVALLIAGIRNFITRIPA